jgi:hypothetical protein
MADLSNVKGCSPCLPFCEELMLQGVAGGEDAELAQQTEGIHDDAGVLDTAILQTVDDHPPDANGASGGGNTEKLTSSSTNLRTIVALSCDILFSLPPMRWMRIERHCTSAASRVGS